MFIREFPPSVTVGKIKIDLSTKELRDYHMYRDVHGHNTGSLSDEQIMALTLWLSGNPHLLQFTNFYAPRNLIPIPETLGDEG